MNLTGLQKAVIKLLESTTSLTLSKTSEAPADGKQYARKDGAWVEVVAGVTLPADPEADKFLKWNDTSNELEWDDAGGAFSGTMDDITDGSTYVKTENNLTDDLSSAIHTQNTDTGTTNNTFTIDSDSTTGKIIIDVNLGASDRSLNLTNEVLTNNRTLYFPDADGVLALAGNLSLQYLEAYFEDTFIDFPAYQFFDLIGDADAFSDNLPNPASYVGYFLAIRLSNLGSLSDITFSTYLTDDIVFDTAGQMVFLISNGTYWRIINKYGFQNIDDTAYDATSWNDNLDAPTKNAVRDKFESLNSAKQDTLISGTNIKTVNSNSLLGSGDIVISGSSPTSWGKYF